MLSPSAASYSVVGDFISPPPSARCNNLILSMNNLMRAVPDTATHDESSPEKVALDQAVDRLRAMLCHGALIIGDISADDGEGSRKAIGNLTNKPGHNHSVSDSSENDGSNESNKERDWLKARELWRWIICEWSYKVITYFGMSTSTLWASLSYLDRYIDISGPCNNKEFKLAAMASLYLAIKIYEMKEKKVSAAQIAHLSRDDFSPEDITRMEMRLLTALSWRVNIPTPLSFVHEFINVSEAMRALPEDATAHLTELCEIGVAMSVYEQSCVCVHPSTVAFALVLVAMDHVNSPIITADLFHQFCEDIYGLTGARHDPEITLKFHELFNQHSRENTIERSGALGEICDDDSPVGKQHSDGYDTPTFVADFNSANSGRHSPGLVDAVVVSEEADQSLLSIRTNNHGDRSSNQSKTIQEKKSFHTSLSIGKDVAVQ
mmetsp:Transcript_22486/g.51495  ORF Transcript_22486/g.51495 Transcript_22486/m.51495 type:complete len:435 (-) Transcript_22486:486-1790(-)